MKFANSFRRDRRKSLTQNDATLFRLKYIFGLKENATNNELNKKYEYFLKHFKGMHPDADNESIANELSKFFYDQLLNEDPKKFYGSGLIKGGAEVNDNKLSGEEQSKQFKEDSQNVDPSIESVEGSVDGSNDEDLFINSLEESIQNLKSQRENLINTMNNYKQTNAFKFFDRIYKQIGKSKFETTFSNDYKKYISDYDESVEIYNFRNDFNRDVGTEQGNSKKYQEIKKKYASDEKYGKYVDKAKFNAAMKHFNEFESRYNKDNNIPIDELDQNSIEGYLHYLKDGVDVQRLDAGIQSLESQLEDQIEKTNLNKTIDNEKTQKLLEQQKRVETERQLDQTTQEKQRVETLLNFSKNTNPVVELISRFSKSMNQLLIFFKGKIKSNLKSIDKSKIQDMLTDMNLLDENFNSVDLDLNHTYQAVFGIDGKYKDKKENKLLSTFEDNFKKISSEIIHSLKSYSSLGNYTSNSQSKEMLFPDSSISTNKFKVSGSGLMMHDCMRSRMNNPHKYLM